VSRRRLANLCLIFCVAALAVTRAAELPPGTAAPRSLEDLIRSLQPLGIDVIFSSELVLPGMPAPAPRAGETPLQQLQAALGAQGLELRPLAPDKYVVVRARERAPPQTLAEGPLPEISVYASRYSMEGQGIADPRRLTSSDIDSVPGSHDDALRALKALPGLASNASGRPYIRGSLADDVLVRYDGITLLDPFHLKNFQSLISAIDPAGVERIEVFSGGFPVRYGTRSGGVIDITAPSSDSGHEMRAGASLISAGVSTLGRAKQAPLDWLFAIRRSTIDLLEPVEEELGEPQFSDSLGRLRWHTENGAWTLGWLLLDDRLRLGEASDSELANARYRDEYLWLARDHRFDSQLTTRATVVVTSSNRHRTGTLNEPGVSLGELDAALEFDRIEATNTWNYEQRPDLSWSFGAAAAVSTAEYDYQRSALYDPEIAAAFGRPVQNDLLFDVRPEVFTYAMHGALRKRWSPFEAELGLRLDGQHYNLGGDHTQISPRLNLRYDRNERVSLYASLGRFSQAQHVEEWRVEDAQAVADSAQVSIHGVVGLTWRQSPDTRWGLEAYTKRWTTIAPYFDNRLDPLALLPELGPDRIRLAPAKSEASGLEVNLHHDLSEKLSAWGTLSWSRVADDMAGGDVLRSWDQPVALTAGAAWQNSRLAVSALASWHSGWPRNAFELTTPAGAPGGLVLGPRNSERWGDFHTIDLRASYDWPLAGGDLEVVFEVTNATNRGNPCCARLEASASGDYFVSETDHWLPIIVNLGFSYRIHKP
jgi:outer membrane receptor protein involved in Fe transport